MSKAFSFAAILGTTNLSWAEWETCLRGGLGWEHTSVALPWPTLLVSAGHSSKCSTPRRQSLHVVFWGLEWRSGEDRLFDCTLVCFHVKSEVGLLTKNTPTGVFWEFSKPNSWRQTEEHNCYLKPQDVFSLNQFIPHLGILKWYDWAFPKNVW